jgi:hypothetical protein
MNDQQKLFLTIGAGLKGAEQSQMFGKLCFKVNGKAFICFFEDEAVFKLSGKVHEQALALTGSKLFDPSGKKRPMKEWVQVPSAHEGKWKKLAAEAMKYVGAE